MLTYQSGYEAAFIEVINNIEFVLELKSAEERNH